MKCRHARRALRLRLDESLALEHELRLEAHLADCERCRSFSTRTQVLEEALVRLPEPPVERLDVERAVLAVRGRVQAQPTPRNTSRPRSRLAAVVALAAAACLALWIGVRWQTGDPREDAPGEGTLALDGQGPPEEQPLEDVDSPREIDEQLARSTEPASPSLPALDVQRLAEARAEVRQRLAELGTSLDHDSTPAEVDAFAELFELDTIALRRGGWPVRRIVEGSLDAEDLGVASAASRYLGVRGDSSSARHLRRALQREELAATALLALVDLGDDGRDGLSDALELPTIRESAIRGLVELGGTESARALGRAYASSGGEGLEREVSLLDGLARLGSDALPEWVDLHARGVLADEPYLARLEELEGAADWFGRCFESSDVEASRSFLMGACHVVPEWALPWLEANLHERLHRELARELLPTLPGPETVALLIRLDGDSRLRSDDLAAMTAVALELDVARFTRAAEDRGPRSSHERETLAELLLTSESEGALQPLLSSLADVALSEPLRTAAALRIGESTEDGALTVLTEVFLQCTVDERKLAAACLLGIARIGGEEALATALEGGSRRATQNIHSLLQRRGAGERTTPSIYKLSRELKPFLSARDRENRRTSS